MIKTASAAGLKLLARETIPPFVFLLVFGKATSPLRAVAVSAPMRTALTIAGSDSGGGAGIQADLKTFAALGVYGTSAITAITAQNTVGVTAVSAVAADLVTAQIEAVAGDIALHATKTGMLATAAIVEAVARRDRRARSAARRRRSGDGRQERRPAARRRRRSRAARRSCCRARSS